MSEIEFFSGDDADDESIGVGLCTVAPASQLGNWLAKTGVACYLLLVTCCLLLVDWSFKFIHL